MGVTSANMVTLGYFIRQRMSFIQRLRPRMRAEKLAPL